MKIVFRKLNLSSHSLSVIRNGVVFDEVVLDTRTYFLHDIVHYCVETELKLIGGFWGMIAKGYKMAQLSGKNNGLTEELRRVERIVGPVQSVFSGHLSIEMFEEHMKLIDFVPQNVDFVGNVIAKAKVLVEQWKYLPTGECLELEF
jgi:hypothetical protein